MTTQDKRQPAFNDESIMPFGKWKGERMMDIPDEYFRYMKGVLGEVKQHTPEIADKLPQHQKNTLMFVNYIHNSWEALKD